MKTLNEIIKEAKEYSDNFEKYEKNSSTGIRPPVSSGPKARAFVEYILNECKQNGIELPSGLKGKEEFLSSFSEGAIEKKFSILKEKYNVERRSNEKKESLLKFAESLSEDGMDPKILSAFLEDKGLSEVDQDFIYNSYLVRCLVEANKEKQVENVNLESLSDEEIQSFSKEFLQKTIEKTEQEIDQRLLKNTLNNNRSIAAIIGVPGSGKSTFINKLKREGYISIDLDEIAVEIAKRNGIEVSACEGQIYREAGRVADAMAKEAMQQGYNIAVEKIGHSKEEIYQFTEKYVKMAEESGLSPSASLLLAHVPKETSTIRAAGRTMEQIEEGKPLRYYQDSEVYAKDNTSVYSYLDVLEDHLKGKKSVFSKLEMRIQDGLQAEDGNLKSLSYNETKREAYQQKQNDVAKLKQQEEEYAKRATLSGSTMQNGNTKI